MNSASFHKKIQEFWAWRLRSTSHKTWCCSGVLKIFIMPFKTPLSILRSQEISPSRSLKRPVMLGHCFTFHLLNGEQCTTLWWLFVSVLEKVTKILRALKMAVTDGISRSAEFVSPQFARLPIQPILLLLSLARGFTSSTNYSGNISFAEIQAFSRQ